MTSKTFKSSRPTGTVLRVESTEVFSEAHLTIVLHSREEDICIAPSDAPALALAILEAAGIDSAVLAEAEDYLKSYMEVETKRAAEAKDQAELEAEALELFNASRLERGLDELDWVRVTPSERAEWLAVARKAREMRTEK